MEIRVNATRQELTRLKARVRMAKRGHKLLKDKRDQLMKEFLAIVHESQKLRQELEERLLKAEKSFSLARAVLSPPSLEEALMASSKPRDVSLTEKHIMNVVVPVMTMEDDGEEKVEQGSEGKSKGVLPYGLASTSSDLDDAVGEFRGILPLLVRLSYIERSIQLLADEIEKTRRRVNALEYVLIPELEQAVKDVEMRLEEMERSNASRLMKIKDIVRAH